MQIGACVPGVTAVAAILSVGSMGLLILLCIMLLKFTAVVRTWLFAQRRLPATLPVTLPVTLLCVGGC